MTRLTKLSNISKSYGCSTFFCRSIWNYNRVKLYISLHDKTSFFLNHRKFDQNNLLHALNQSLYLKNFYITNLRRWFWLHSWLTFYTLRQVRGALKKQKIKWTWTNLLQLLPTPLNCDNVNSDNLADYSWPTVKVTKRGKFLGPPSIRF